MRMTPVTTSVLLTGRLAEERSTPPGPATGDEGGNELTQKENQLRGYQAIRDFCDPHLKVPPLAHD